MYLVPVSKLYFMFRILFFVFFSLLLNPCFAQYNWKLEKQKNGISVFLSDVIFLFFKFPIVLGKTGIQQQAEEDKK